MQGRNGTGSRRSSRVILHVPLQIYDPGTNQRFPGEEACALKVSLWGGLIALKSAVSQGQKLSMLNQATRETTESRVVYLGPMQLGKRLVGIEFLEASPRFWGLTFPAVAPQRHPVRSAYA